MKKLLASVTLVLLLLMSGCVGADAPKTISTPQQAASNTVQANSSANASQQKSAAHSAKLTMEVAGKPVTIKLADNAATKRLISQLPADLEFKDFNNTEKIAYPKEKINIDGAPKASYYEDAVNALNIKLTSDDIKYLEELYTPHKIVGAL